MQPCVACLLSLSSVFSVLVFCYLNYKNLKHLKFECRYRHTYISLTNQLASKQLHQKYLRVPPAARDSQSNTRHDIIEKERTRLGPSCLGANRAGQRATALAIAVGHYQPLWKQVGSGLWGLVRNTGARCPRRGTGHSRA